MNYKFIIFFIVILSLGLRFYNLPQSFVFAGDEEYQATLATTLIKDFHIIWVGVNAAHLGFYLGPYWTYFTAFWLWISGGNPLITGYVSSLIGVLTTFLVIFTGSILFNKKTGILAGLLYATLPLMIYLDQKYWNPSLIPILSLLILLSLYNLKQNPKWLMLLALASGLIFHTHLSLFPLLLIIPFWILLKKIKFPKKIFALSLTLFLLTIAPLIAFDYFHKGSNITTPLRFSSFSSDPVNNINPKHHFNAFFQGLGRIFYLKPYGNNADEVITSCTTASRLDAPAIVDQISKRTTPHFLLSFFGLTLLLIFIFNKSTWKKDNSTLVALFTTSIIIFFLLFPGGAFEYYLLGIFPLILFLPGILMDNFSKLKPFLSLFIFIVSTLGIFTVFSNIPDFGIGAKNNLIKQVISILGNETFEIKQTGICHAYEGWRYLFISNGKTPLRSDSDKGMGWLYQNEISAKDATYTIVLSETRVPINFNTENATIITSGGFTGYIFKNY